MLALAETIHKGGDSLVQLCAKANGRIAGNADLEWLQGMFSSLGMTPRDVLKLDHLKEQYYHDDGTFVFELMLWDGLDRVLRPYDLMYIDSLEDVPYFICNFNLKNPRGVMELAATIKLRDLLWAARQLPLSSPSLDHHIFGMTSICAIFVPRWTTENWVRLLLKGFCALETFSWDPKGLATKSAR